MTMIEKYVIIIIVTFLFCHNILRYYVKAMLYILRRDSHPKYGKIHYRLIPFLRWCRTQDVILNVFHAKKSPSFP